MSKRLRASIIAGNRGRSLRPRTSRPPSEVDAQGLDATQAPLEAADGDADEGRASAASEPPRAPLPAAAEALPAAVDLRSSPAVEPAAAAAVVAEPPPAAPPAEAAAPAAPEPPAALAALEPPAVPAPLAAPEPPEPPSKPRAERSVEIPAAPRIEAAPLEVEAPPSSARRAGHDAVDLSSVSSEFFRGDEDSVPPLVDTVGGEHHDEPAPESVVHPAALARRARLRRIVGAVIGVAGVVALAGIGKSLIFSSKPPQQAPQPVAVVTAPAPPPEAKPTPATQTKPAPAPAPAPAPEAKAAEPPADAKAAEPKAEEKAPDPADAAKLKKDALNFLNRGRYKDAIETARAAIAADPADAMTYLYLGSALQDSGKWKEGIEAYSDCVRNAKKGPVHECSAMGGRK